MWGARTCMWGARTKMWGAGTKMWGAQTRGARTLGRSNRNSFVLGIIDQIYFLYCYFQNNGDVSLSNATSQIKQPMKQDLKWSEDDTRDGQPECKKKRNDWVTDQCKKIFGDNYPDPEHYGVRYFQENLLQLQAIKKVDQSGNEVLRPDGGLTLVCACNI